MARFQVHDVHRVNKKGAARRKGRHTPPPLSRTSVARDKTPGLIHRSSNPNRASITKLLGVHGNTLFLKQLREFAARYLDFDVRVSEQPAQWEQFCNDVAAEFPIIAKYKNVWIVRDYLNHYLHGRTKNRQRQRVSGTRNASNSTREVVEVNSAEPSAHGEVAENAEPVHAVDANRGRKKRPVIQNLAYVEIIQKRPVFSASRKLDQASSSSRCSKHVPLVPEDSSEPVKQFLESLVPDLSYLWPVFDKLGINNAVSLDGMKSWPSERRDAVLMDFVCEGKITRFERDAIRLGLV